MANYIELGNQISSASGGGSDVNLHDGAGTPVSSTLNGGKQSLDVNITSGTTGHVIIDNAAIDVNLTAAGGDNVAIKDATGTNALSISAAGAAKVDGSDVTQPISASALLLPSGASTEATLSALNSKVTAVNTGAVVVSSSALPTGAATETTLSSLDSKVTAVNTGAVVISSSALPTGAATEATLASQGKAEESVHSSGDIGIAALTVRQDTPTAMVAAAGRYANLQTDSVGRLWVRPSFPGAFYQLVTAPFTPAATPTDMFRISGSASTLVRIWEVYFTGVATATSIQRYDLVKRSTANTGGTSVASVLVPNDSTSGAATASAVHYTANPTVGTAVGSVGRQNRVVIPITTGATGDSSVSKCLFKATEVAKTIVLHGTAEGLCLFGNSATLPTGAANYMVSVFFSEE